MSLSSMFRPVPEDTKYPFIVFEKRKKSIISSIVRFFTHSDYCHVEFWEPDSGITIGSRPWRGVATGTLDDFQNPVLAKIDCPMDSDRYARLYNDALTYVGLKYDYKGVLGFLINRFKVNHNRVKCSHLVDEVLKKHGIVLINKESIKVTPQDLAESILVEFVGSEK